MSDFETGTNIKFKIKLEWKETEIMEVLNLSNALEMLKLIK